MYVGTCKLCFGPKLLIVNLFLHFNCFYLQVCKQHLVQRCVIPVQLVVPVMISRLDLRSVRMELTVLVERFVY